MSLELLSLKLGSGEEGILQKLIAQELKFSQNLQNWAWKCIVFFFKKIEVGSLELKDA